MGRHIGRYGSAVLVTVALLLAWNISAPAASTVRCKSAAEVTQYKPKPVTGKTPTTARYIARQVSRSRGWHHGSQWRCLVMLWQRESGWRHNADNPNSSAYGIAQILNTPSTITPTQQIQRGIRYIEHRYGSPCAAWHYWQKHHWY